MVERAHISESLRVLDGADPANASDWHAARDAVRRMLCQLGTQGIGDALGGVIESLPSLAAELGKPAPVVHIDSHGHRVRSEIAATLKNVFMHLLRNSMDHGIESSDERRAAGKATSGTIDIAVGVGGGELWFVLSDDGRGLALDRIRGIARERGWIDADHDAALSDDEVAELIFRPGFSTASTVTEVSGRGVGMDAVRNFLKRDGGDIALRFTDDRVGAPYRAFETIVSLPARFAADVAAWASCTSMRAARTSARRSDDVIGQAWMIQMAAALAGGVVVAIVAAVVFRVTRTRLVEAHERDTARLRGALDAADARVADAASAHAEAADAWAQREAALEDALARETSAAGSQRDAMQALSADRAALAQHAMKIADEAARLRGSPARSSAGTSR